MQVASGALSGILFAVGLAVAGMTQPQKVLAFLDFTGHWDPSLAFVMGGAIAVYAPLYRFIVKRTMPLYAQQFVVFSDKQIDARLIGGAALFGVGWGIAGYCPGPGLTALGTFAIEPIVFIACMAAGMLAHHAFEAYRVRLASNNQVASSS